MEGEGSAVDRVAETPYGTDVKVTITSIWGSGVIGRLNGSSAILVMSTHRPLRAELLHPHVVDDEQVGLQVSGHDLVFAAEGLVVEEVADGVEDRAVEDGEATLDGLVAIEEKNQGGQDSLRDAGIQAVHQGIRNEWR